MGIEDSGAAEESAGDGEIATAEDWGAESDNAVLIGLAFVDDADSADLPAVPQPARTSTAASATNGLFTSPLSRAGW